MAIIYAAAQLRLGKATVRTYLAVSIGGLRPLFSGTGISDES